MKKLITLTVCIVCVLAALAVAAGAKDGFKFDDVKDSKWYANVVYDVYEKGIMTGKTDKTFGPEDKMTRAEIVTILCRMSKDNAEGKSKSLAFKDTKQSDWYADSVGWAVENKVVNGYEDNTFKPKANVTRQELAALLIRFFEYKGINLEGTPLINKFADASKIQSWAKESCEKMRKSGLIGGDDNGNFNPKNNASRAEIANIVSRYYGMNEMDTMYECYQNFKDKTGSSMVQYIIYHGSLVNEDTLGAFILDKIGLSFDSYKVLIPEKNVDRIFLWSYKLDNFKEEVQSVPFRIQNRKTGETTEEYRVRLSIRKDKDYESTEDIFINPKDFNPLVSDEVYAQMLDASVFKQGDLARLAKAYGKLEKGEAVNVAYIGGSITEGASGDRFTCWARTSFNMLCDMFPNTLTWKNFYNMGVGGTGSVWASVRFRHDILTHNPDIIFIEYDVNDGNGEDEITKDSFESIIRLALEQENQPAVILIRVSTGHYRDESMPFRNNLADYYGLPYVNFNNGIQKGIELGAFVWDGEFTLDQCHPCEWGQMLTGHMLGYNLQKFYDTIKTMSGDDLVIKPIPDALTPLEHYKLTYYDSTNLTPVSTGSWSAEMPEVIHNLTMDYALWQHEESCREKGWTHSSGNEPLSFDITGKTFYFVYTDYLKDEYKELFGKAIVSIDGVDVTTLDPSEDAARWGREPMSFSCDEDKEHHIEIRMAEGDENKRFDLWYIEAK